MANSPLEVQMLIMEWVYRLSQSKKIDYATLRACALVCHAWTPTAQRLLFRRVPHAQSTDSRQNPDAIPLLIRTLRNNPYLSTAVRSISIKVDIDEVTSELSDGVALLELCPHVQGIEIEDFMNTDVMYPALEARLRAIQLHPVFLYPYGRPSFVALLLRTWPNLRVLHVIGWVNDALPPISATGTLQALIFLEWECIEWLLPPGNDFTALRDLELIEPFWHDDGWQQLQITSVLSRLYTLRVSGLFPPQEFLEHLKDLESLTFTDLPQEDITLPPRLRYVGYHRDVWDSNTDGSMECMIAALRPLAHLQLVTTTRGATEAQIKALAEVCRDRAVALEIRQTTRDFPYPRWDIDWI
ncbi:hypothetical protein FA95DRAFT_1602218 [Auriscalpium vulgare]|uniref:Uncharacterized protein n=1 Tax=Auriscalpium vulgare TaxID=40419 RepID=A0ACB8S859_9AGAM|nr:hypothetical protein FA95DRAFT_1602218 [Auriscalpium vulgare]